jgi:hypothetical protein
VIDTDPPSPPDEMTVRPDSVRKQIAVSFKLPLNNQMDIYYMRLFRKLQDQNGVDLTSWVQVGSNWGPENVLYYDTDVDFFQNNHIRYAYAAQTVTRHNEYSSLSDQLSSRLNSEYAAYGEYPIDFMSQAGVKLEHHGAFAVSPYKRYLTELVVPNDANFTFSGRHAHGTIALDGNQYFVRIESLDTGEKIDYPINIIYNNQATKINRKTLSVANQSFTTPVTKPVGTNPSVVPVYRNWKSDKQLPRSITRNPVGKRNFMPSGIK